MTDTSSFASDWIKAEEVAKFPSQKTIVYPQEEGKASGGKYDKWEIPVTFNGEERKLSLNKTSVKAIQEEYGTDDKDWINKPILLYITQMPIEGKMKDVMFAKVPTEEERKTIPVVLQGGAT